MKSDHQKRVEEFMIRAGQTIPDKPTIPDEQTRLLRARLILEEAFETVKALGCKVELEASTPIIDVSVDNTSISLNFFGPDLEAIADGIADISVVSIGTLSACGISDIPILEEVDKSNLAKFETPKCDECGGDTYLENANSGGYVCAGHTGHTNVIQGPYRRSDGKWIKGPDWKAPDLKSRLKEQGWDG